MLWSKKTLAALLGILLSLAAFDVWDRATAAMKAEGKPDHPFTKNCKVSLTETMMIVESDGIPNHKHGNFPNRDNPNKIEKQHYRFEIPRHPKRAEKTTPTPMGPIGVAVNGIPFYNQYNAEGGDAVKLEVFDSCCGHPDPGNRYHYHKYPVCVKSPFKDTPGEHSPLIGYAFDGYGIYGPRGEQGKPPTDLDECNGHTDSQRGYHYHCTTEFPYIIGAYRGEPNQKMLARNGPPGGGRPGQGPGGGGPGGMGPGRGGPGQGGPGQGGPGQGRPGFGPGGRRPPPPGFGPPGGGPPPQGGVPPDDKGF